MTATTRDYIDIVTGYYPPAGPAPITVDDTLMCLRHAGQLGYGPEQAEYGYDPDDGLNPTPETLTEEAGQ